jgi:hypothetical protein
LGGFFPLEITPDIVSDLPRNVEMLYCEGVEPFSFTPDAVVLAPENFIRVFVQECSFLELERMSSPFPPHILHLSVAHLPESLLLKLPAELQTLIIDDEEVKLNADLVSLLPRNLTELHIDSPLYPVDDAKAVFKALPRTLTSLRLLPGPDGDMTEDPYLSDTSIDSSQFLPPCLKTLEIGDLDINGPDLAQWILGMPKSLTRFSLCVDRLAMNSFGTLGSLTCLEYLSIEFKIYGEYGWSQCIALGDLPRNLTTMNLEEDRKRDLTDEFFTEAPPSLTSMRLPISPLLTKECLSFLPNLEEIHCMDHSSQPSWIRG